MLWFLAFLAVSVGFQITCLLSGGLTLSVTLLGFIVVSNLIILQTGVLILCRLRMSLSAEMPAAYVMGYGLVSFLVMILVVVLGLSPQVAALIVAGLALAMTAVMGTPHLQDNRLDTLLCAGIAIGVIALSASAVASPKTLAEVGTLPTWYDAYLHGLTIHALQLGSDIEFIGSGLVFYHYAPFVLPAALSEATGLDGLTLSATYLLPFGFWVGALGLYAFCHQLGGHNAAIIAFALLILLPGPSEYVIDSGWLDMVWLLFTSPGAGYAIGLCFLAAATIHAAQSQGVWRFYGVAVALLIIVVFQRVHFFMLAAPALVAVSALAAPPRLRAGLIWSVCGAAMLLAVALATSSHLRTEWIAFARPFEYLDITLRWSENYVPDVEPYLDTGFWGRSAQLGVNLVASLGIFLFVALVLGLIKVRRLGFAPMDGLALFLVLSYLLLILFSPPGGNGDVSEYKHRHVILLYTAFVAMSAIWATQISRSKSVTLSAGVLGLLGLAVSVSFYGKPVDAPNGRAMPWSADYHNRAISEGVLESAQYLSDHVREGDVLATGRDAAHARLGSLIELLGLVRVSAYMSRGDLKMLRSECHAAEVETRLETLAAVEAAKSRDDAWKSLQAAGIRWFVRFDNPPAWDADGTGAVFASGPLWVYDAETNPRPQDAWRVCASGH